MGEVPYQALPLLRFFAYKIRAREKVRKGEGEPGDEANLIHQWCMVESWISTQGNQNVPLFARGTYFECLWITCTKTFTTELMDSYGLCT